MELNLNYAQALDMAQFSTSRLWRDDKPLPTNLWAIDAVSFEPSSDGYGIYLPKRASDNGVLKNDLQGFVGGLKPGSLRLWMEEQWLSKFATFRNWYFADTLKYKLYDLEIKWFLWGPPPPPGLSELLEEYFERLVSDTYRPLAAKDIRCPDSSASTGFTYTSDGWLYSGETGPHWAAILEANQDVEEYLQSFAPSWKQLMKESTIIPELETFCVNQPVIRNESGPLDIRLAFNRGKHLYVPGRRIILPIQESFSQDTYHYIGKASHCQKIGENFNDYGGTLIATHGDDWIARFHGSWLSGDWSKFDLRISALFILLSRRALYRVLTRRGLLVKEDQALFRALAYIDSKRMVSWPWSRKDGQLINRVSPRRIVGHVDSGSPDFVMHNNAINYCMLKLMLRRHRAKRFKGWKWFSRTAKGLAGWVAKPSAQKIEKNGFIACRTLFDEEFGYHPIPCVSSVIRNWARPSYDPVSYPENWRVALVTRFLALDETLSLLPEDEWADRLGAVYDAAATAGVTDPAGSEISAQELGYWMQELHGEYSYQAFVQS